MPNAPTRNSHLLIWSFLVVLTLLGCWRYQFRADLPVRLSQSSSGPVVEDPEPGSRPVDIDPSAAARPRPHLVALDGVAVWRTWHTRFLIFPYRAGDTISARIREEGVGERTVDWTLVPGTNLMGTLLMLVLCLALLAMSGLLVARRGRHPAAFPLAITLGLLAASMALDEPGPPLGPQALVWVPGALWGLSYALMPAAIVWFASWFPDRSLLGKEPRRLPLLFLLVGSVFGIGMAAAVGMHAEGQGGMWLYRITQNGIWLLLAGSMLLFLGVLITGYVRGAGGTTRERVLWVAAGTVVGAVPPIAFIQIPLFLGSDPVFSQPVALIFLLALPASLVIAVIRSQLLDITLVIRRSLIYGPATLFVYIVFGGGMVVVTYIILNGVAPDLPALTPEIALVVALPVLIFHLAYEPLRRRAQGFVDRNFFRTRYDYSEVLRRFTAGLEDRLTGDEILPYLSEAVQEVLTSRWVAIEDTTDGRWRERWESVEPRKDRVGPAMHVPFRLLEGMVLAVGPARSGLTYHRFDRDMLAGLVHTTQEVLRRELLQREILEEAAERERIEELTRLKDDFLSLVSHDLRSPLSAIIVSAAMIDRGEDDPSGEKTKAGAVRIQRAAQRAARMVERLLHTARVESERVEPHLEEIPVREVFQGIRERFELSSQQAGIGIEAAECGEIAACVDRDLLAEVLSNLVENALKHSAAGTHIHLEAAREGGRIRLNVRDEGPGIPEEMRDTLFEREKGTLRVSPGGFGLGLYLSRRLMQILSGTLELGQSGTEGTVFTLTVPEAPCAGS